MVGGLGVGAGGRGEIRAEPSETKARVRIETPFLQIVMTCLWDEEQAHDSRQIHRRTLDDLGGAKQIVGDYLDAFMDGLPPQHQAISAAIFHYLVTPSGTKIAQSAGDLAVYADQDREQIAGVLSTLAGPARLLRTVAAARAGGEPRYEMYHDSLAPAVLHWRGHYYQQQREIMVRRRARWAIGIGIFLALVSLAIFIWAQAERSAVATRVTVVAQAETAVATRVTAVAQAGATATVRAQKEAEALSFLSDADQSISQGDYDQAIADCTRAIELVPDLAEAHFKRGFVYTYYLDEYEKAIADYDRAIELDPEYKRAYANKGRALRILDRYDEALTALDQAIQLDPEYVWAYTERGIVYAHYLKEYEKAIADYDRAIELDAEYAYAYFYRGLAYEQLGEKAKAIADFEEFLKLSKDEYWRSQAEQHLRELRGQ